jgi:hypothetical protein
MMRVTVLALTFLLFLPSLTFAEWQLRPFFGITFGGGTTFVDLAGAAGGPNLVYGVNGALLGDIFGIDVDFGRAPGYFQSGDQSLVRQSSATTLTGNVIIAPPRHATEYTLGPYFVVGGGLMHASINDVLSLLPVSRTLPAMDVGGGVNAFVSDRFGLSWDARYFRSVGGGKSQGVSLDPEEASERLSFWRATMAFVIRR